MYSTSSGRGFLPLVTAAHEISPTCSCMLNPGKEEECMIHIRTLNVNLTYIIDGNHVSCCRLENEQLLKRVRKLEHETYQLDVPRSRSAESVHKTDDWIQIDNRTLRTDGGIVEQEVSGGNLKKIY